MSATVVGDTTTIFVGQIVLLAFVLTAAIILIYFGLKVTPKPEWWEKPWDYEEPIWPRKGPSGGELLPVGGTDDRTREVRDDAETHPRVRP